MLPAVRLAFTTGVRRTVCTPLQATYYEFHKEEVDAALDHHQKGHPSGNEVAHDVADRIHNKDAFNILMVRASTPLQAGS